MRLASFLSLGLFAVAALAQTNPPAAPQATVAPPAMPASDPQVNPDHSVTFHYTVPGATSVALALEGAKQPLPMHKADDGSWTVTTPALAPEFYSYHFEVDGGPQLDPRNTIIKSSYISSGNGFLVPGTAPEPWETAAIPHGTVHHHTFATRVVIGLERGQSDYFVYTPPGYDPRGTTKYPVLYLLHGWSDTAAGWSEVGRADEILDALIAQGKARPMIVVMPLGYGEMSFVRSGPGVWQDPEAIRNNVRLFATSLLTEVKPAVEREYLASTRREDRAIAGLSMGGLESISIGLLHPELFASIGGFSSAVFPAQLPALTAIDPAKANLKLLWIACGTEDQLISRNREVIAGLKAKGFAVTQVETPGMHTWMVWRDNLVHFAPLLFQTK